MKKLTAVILICLLIMSLAACGGSQNTPSGGDAAPSGGDQSGEGSSGGDQQSGGDAQPEGEGSGSGTPVQPSGQGGGSDHGEFGDFTIDIEEAVLTQDGDGKPALAVTFTWTNNSDKTLSAWDVWQFYAYQDGIQVDTTWVFDNPDVTLDDKDSTRIRPGASITFQKVFSLFNDVADVEVEVEQWYDYEDDPGVIAACTYELPQA
ncbi:MAG: DUF5067 domain-containing protein [Eubacterium sp.]|nr:DUF5067 domain-containing protein [Eubacterium sp.]